MFLTLINRQRKSLTLGCRARELGGLVYPILVGAVIFRIRANVL